MAHTIKLERVQPVTGESSALLGTLGGHDQSHSSPPRSPKGMPPRLEQVIGPVLRFGATASSTLILAGLALTVLDGGFGSWQPWSRTSGAYPLFTASLDGILRQLASINPESIINLGILVLIATPVTRVASSVGFFFIRRELPYLAITLYVLLVLLAGFFVGATG